FELHSALIEQCPGGIEITQPKVHITDAEKGRALQAWIVAALAFIQHAVEGFERTGQVPLRRIGAAETIERACFASRIRKCAIKRAAAPLGGDCTGEIAFDELDVPGADERSGNSQPIIEALLDSKGLMEGHQRVAVLELRILSGAEPDES